MNGQIKKCIEEIAFNHLDSLIKIEPNLKRIRYFANGYISKEKTELPDTLLFYIGKVENVSLKSEFENLEIIENENITSIKIPKSKRGHPKDTGLKICHFIKSKNSFFVEFKISNNGGFDSITIELNNKGEMTRYYHVGACF